MLHGLVHVALLAAATLGVWVMRSRVVLFLAGLMILPLPATLFNFYEAPQVLGVSGDDLGATSPGDCARREAAPAPASPSGAEEPPDPPPDCVAVAPSRRPAFVAVALVNYIVVLIGSVAGLLVRRSSRRT